MNYEQEQQFAAEVKRYVTEHLPLSQISDSELQQQIEDIVEQRIGAGYCSIEQRVSIVEQVYSSIRGFGLLDSIIKDDTITEVMINGPENVFIEQNGRLFKLDKQFESQRKLEDIIQRIVGLAGREVNQANPICDTRLPDGSRVNVVLPPIALCGPTVTIRKFSKTPMTIAKLIEYGSLTQEIADKLQMLVEAKYNIFISGGTGSGKTTFLNALSNYIPKDERVITIEDSAELQIEGIENLVSLETRNANASGAGQITIRDLIKSSLRMRPERIIVGEVRGGEALDMLQAMNTGHDGSLSTGHANSTEDMLSRLETMVLQGAAGLPLEAIRQQIASAVDIIIHLSRLRDKSRKTMEITEVVGYEDGRIVLNPLYVFEEDENSTLTKVSGRLKPDGICNEERPQAAAGRISGNDIGDFMGKSKKKEKYVPLTGLTGIGEDYNIYIMNPREKIIGYLIGFVAGFLAAQIMFGVVIASIVIGAAVGFYAIPVYRRYLQERRRKAILLQFRDMLDSLSNSFSAGKNTPDAFTDAYSDLKLAYGEQAPIVKEMAIIVSGLHNNFVIEDLLRDMSARCGIDDINSFAETFAVCNRLGGNLKKVVVDSRDIISDKIEIEMEIQTTVAANKNEINIMCVMPFVIIAMMGTLGQASITANTPLNVLVKLIAIFMFVIAYKLGRKITDIKV